MNVIKAKIGIADSKKENYYGMHVETFQSRDIEKDLLPILRETVYHVTTKESYAKISEDCFIRHNKDRIFGYSWKQSENSYFRKRGYVSFVDLRSVSNHELADARDRYNFLCPPCVNNEPVYLILKESLYNLIVGWEVTRKEPGDIVVPYIEAGIRGDIPLRDISKVIKVNQV